LVRPDFGERNLQTHDATIAFLLMTPASKALTSLKKDRRDEVLSYGLKDEDGLVGWEPKLKSRAKSMVPVCSSLVPPNNSRRMDMEPREAKVIANFLMGDLENELQTTLRVFKAVPSGKLHYQPDPVSKTALGLLRHITLDDGRLLNGTADGAFVPPLDESDACGIMTQDDAIALYKEKIPAAIKRVRAMSGEQLCAEIDYLGQLQMTGLGFLLLMLKHSVHHRGQLSAYLRAMGGKVPEIYGSSADTHPSA